MQPDKLYERYRELQRYIDWTDDDARQVRGLGPILKEHFAPLIDDFYAAIQKNTTTSKVITGGNQQIARLKGELLKWLDELFSGQYDENYVFRRWKVGMKHVEIGLDQVYTNAALSRLRNGLLTALGSDGYNSDEIFNARRSLNKLLDLDLAIIEDSYQTERTRRQQRIERLATIGQVAGGIAHELRNPLNVIKTSAYYLRNAKSLSADKTATHLERIDRQATMADGVISALNDFLAITGSGNATARLAQLPERCAGTKRVAQCHSVDHRFSKRLAKNIRRCPAVGDRVHEPRAKRPRCDAGRRAVDGAMSAGWAVCRN